LLVIFVGMATGSTYVYGNNNLRTRIVGRTQVTVCFMN